MRDALARYEAGDHIRLRWHDDNGNLRQEYAVVLGPAQRGWAVMLSCGVVWLALPYQIEEKL
jgi:hypothetical protein